MRCLFRVCYLFKENLKFSSFRQGALKAAAARDKIAFSDRKSFSPEPISVESY
jgi:hypothetical protein